MKSVGVMQMASVTHLPVQLWRISLHNFKLHCLYIVEPTPLRVQPATDQNARPLLSLHLAGPLVKCRNREMQAHRKRW